MAAAFITGAGTGVGKTFVACGLIRHYRRQGRSVSAIKPIVSGFDPASPSGSDPALLLGALGEEFNAVTLERVSPWRFRAPLSPDMAARAERRPIDFPAVSAFCRAAMAEARGTLLIEGIGGIMVPLDARHTVLDLMIAVKAPVVLLGGSYLGALSHTLSAQEALLRNGLGLCAIAISESQGSEVPFEETLVSLGHFAKAPLLALKRQDRDGPNAKVFHRLGEIIG
ncbi:MAG TPA: dethiobiotin synthase [Methylocella sp.]|nr:dethiobiotin synthase [Methylocella sp.]